MYSSPPMYLRKKLLRPRLIRDEIVVLVGRKRKYAVVNHLDAGLQPRHPIDRPTFLADDDMRIGQRAAVEQVRRDNGVAAFERLAVDVLVGEQSPVGWGVVGRVQPDDDHVDVRLPASVRTPREGMHETSHSCCSRPCASCC